MKKTSLLLAAILFTGCYHATIETGRAPSPQQIDVPWAKSFIYGLVPPATVEAQQQCTSGVARVETQHSFLNGLVQFLTFGIFTPMHITVTCASAEEQEEAGLPTVETEEELEEVMEAGGAFLVPLQ